MQYKNRVNAIAKTCEGFNEQELSVMFVENMNGQQIVFKSDKARLIADEKLHEYPATVEQAYHRRPPL